MTFILSFFLLISAENLQTSEPCAKVKNTVPIFDNQKNVTGCRITEVEQGSVYEKLGLKVGDVVNERSISSKKMVLNQGGTVKSISGKSPSSPQEAMQMYQSLKAQKKMNLEVERNGEKKKMEYKVE